MISDKILHEKYMRHALDLAQRATGFTSPNPMVGAVVVRDGQVVGAGYHQRAGGPHAEVHALAEAGASADGATMYVTLEPCNHHGRTPPCTEAVIKAGIRELFYATGDPNPQVAGSGHRRLEEAGVRVQRGPLTTEAMALNRFFFHYIQHRRPYVVAKFGASLDGKIATRTGHSQWITSPEARQHGHQFRQAVDAILVGAETAISDDPQLTTRLPDTDKISHPTRFVLDSHGRVPLSARLYQPDALPGQTVVVTTARMPADYRQALLNQGVEVWQTPATAEGRIDLTDLLRQMGERELISLLVEGGGQVHSAFFEAGLVNEVHAYLSPLIIGGQDAPSPVSGLGIAHLSEAKRLAELTVTPIGPDVLISGRIVQT